MRFFQAWDCKNEADGVGTIAYLPEINIPTSTARSWLKLRELIGDAAFRSQRKSSCIIGRPTKVSASDLTRLTNQDDPIHEKGWQEQANSCPGKPSAKTLQRHVYNAGARRFKKRYQKQISQANRPKRVEYGKEHEKKTILGFWSWIWFTDEAHFQSKELANAPEYELRFPGQERGVNEELEGVLDVTIHVAGGISYNKKGNLIFYKDPAEPSEKVRRQVKQPKQLKYELDSVYQARLKVWQDLKAKEDETPKGNCMTQVFYAKKILPQHIEAIQALEKRQQRKYWLQEDGDPSHGIKSPNSDPAVIKREADLLLLIHPPQSCDLNPIESCWNIIKSRLAGRRWSSVAHFKAEIQAEWDKITLTMIRKRIREMPERCKMIQQKPEIHCKSNVW